MVVVGKKAICGKRCWATPAHPVSYTHLDVYKRQTDDPALIPWATGVIAGTAVNKSATNMDYDGEYQIDTDYTQSELEAGILEGSFMFHLVDEKVVVLEDINTFISVTDEKSGDFSSNQTIRVLDQIANDIAVLFGKKYLGKVPNLSLIHI